MKKIYSKFEHETIAICTDHVSCADIEISGDDTILYIDRADDGFPLFELEKVNWKW